MAQPAIEKVQLHIYTPSCIPPHSRVSPRFEFSQVLTLTGTGFGRGQYRAGAVQQGHDFFYFILNICFFTTTPRNKQRVASFTVSPLRTAFSAEMEL
jgi:hypothetical protein